MMWFADFRLDPPDRLPTPTQDEHGKDCEGTEEATAAQIILDEVEPLIEG